MNHRIYLGERWENLLRDSPEAGMGYWIATVRTTRGEVFTNVVIDSGWVVEVPGYAGIPFTLEEIDDLQVTNDKSRYHQV
jgi:hypothetical protein